MEASDKHAENRVLARTFYEKGRYSELIDLLKNGANDGDPVCMRDLGWSYYCGDAGSPDLEKALRWFQEAARHDEPGGYYGIGAVYFDRKQYEAALQNFCRAASMGWPVAARWAGMMYENGMGVDRDLSLAESYYKQSADQGNLRGKRLLVGLWLSGYRGISGRIWGCCCLMVLFFQMLVVAYQDKLSPRLR